MSHRSRVAVRLLLLAVVAVLPLSTHAAELPVAADAHVYSARITSNYGSLANLYVGNGYTAFVQFDLSGLPSGITASQVASAKATFFVNRIYAPGAIDVAPVTSAWTESNVTFSTAPTAAATIVSFTPGAGGIFVTVDLTAILQGWIANPSSNYGIALTSANGSYTLDSKETTKPGTLPASTSLLPPWAQPEPPAQRDSRA